MKNLFMKVLSVIFLILLIITIFMPEGSFNYLIFIGLFAGLVSIFISLHIKKIKKSKSSRIVSVILMNLILFSLIQLVHALSDIGWGEKGLSGTFVKIIQLIVLGLAMIIGIVFILKDKNQVYGGEINKKLGVILGVILLILFYNSILGGLAEITNAQGLCSFHIELRQNSFGFGKSLTDSCLTDIAVEKKNTNICASDSCIKSIAYHYKDLSICNQVDDYDACIYSVVIQLMYNPSEITLETCEVLTEKEAKENCLKRFAFELDDAKYCLDLEDFGNCYRSLANVQLNDDETQCNPIRNEVAKAYCKNYVHAEVLDSTLSDVPTS